ncbi:arylesterase [Pseudoxanthomonas sp.]|uniref:arylesterase n=1 Tax=Pseudoxanthomonas sp. TaxID=1871049 RepID=UPI00260F6C02|nr:arylesterase [Pseudoxanthomonas sp.]WDS34656.1 MAG: arylesterase [Pseudoxanthomonas sp.]
MKQSGYAVVRRPVQWGLALVLMTFMQSLLAQPAVAATATTKTVLVMGDSLSAGYGLGPTEGWVPLTTAKVTQEKPGWNVVNASISGETSAGGAARIGAQLQRLKPAVVVIELGANDGLRGLPLAQTKTNLEKMITAAQQSGARVLLLGMQMPPNLGRAYTEGFAGNFSALAKQYDTAFIPFFLQPIASDRANFQADNLHPTAAVQPQIRDFVWPKLGPLLK